MISPEHAITVLQTSETAFIRYERNALPRPDVLWVGSGSIAALLWRSGVVRSDVIANPSSGGGLVVLASGILWWTLALLIWIALAFWPARVAGRKGHSFVGFFIFSLFFFPAALIVAYIVGDRTRLAV